MAYLEMLGVARRQTLHLVIDDNTRRTVVDLLIWICLLLVAQAL